MTTIIGIDAATQAKKQGLARGRLDGQTLVIDEVLLGADVASSVEETLAKWVTASTLFAIDAPLGWPVSLAKALVGHHAGQGIEAAADDLFRRHTDRFVQRVLGKRPLDVGADRIARTARAALGLLTGIRARTGQAIPLAWSPKVRGVAAVEVYPAATLEARGIGSTGYKGKGKDKKAASAEGRRRILNAVANEWRLNVQLDVLIGSDDCLDAALCVLAGADFLLGRCVAPDENERKRAVAEGWIWFKKK